MTAVIENPASGAGSAGGAGRAALRPNRLRPGDVLRELRATRTTVVVITHDREVAAQLDRQVRMRDGRIEDIAC